MGFINRQVFSPSDPLGDYKKRAINKYHTCNFLEDDHIPSISTTLNRGEVKDKHVFERIITNGNISLQKFDQDPSYIIWQECALKIDDKTTLTIQIEGADFYVVTLHYGSHVRHDIFSRDDDLELYNDILGLLYQRQNKFQHLSSIQFVSPTLIALENKTDTFYTKDLIDTMSGKVKRLK